MHENFLMKIIILTTLCIMTVTFFNSSSYASDRALIAQCQELSSKVVVNFKPDYDTWHVGNEIGKVYGFGTYGGRFFNKEKKATFFCKYNAEYIMMEGFQREDGSFYDGFNPSKYIEKRY